MFAERRRPPFTAPTPGSGKTALAQGIWIITVGNPGTVIEYPDDPHEGQKLVLSLLRQASPVTIFDNVEKMPVPGYVSETLTSERYEGRLLGVSETLNVSTATLFMFTGNNIIIEGDMRTRCLPVRIDPQQEDPTERHFDKQLREIFLERRAELIEAA